MGFLISLLAPRLGKTAAGLIVYLGLAAAIVGGLLYYGHVKYHDGVEDTDAKWKKAGEKLEKKVAQAAGGADTKAAQRVEIQNERVAKEKERLDEAEQRGTSPFDVLFGNSVQ